VPVPGKAVYQNYIEKRIKKLTGKNETLVDIVPGVCYNKFIQVVLDMRNSD